MKIFITGASGFVGGAALKRFSPEHQITAMSRSDESDKKIEAIGGTPVRCQLGSVDVAHLEGCHVVIHSAAYIGPWGSLGQYWQSNVEGTAQLLEVAKKAGVKRFIHIGTEAGCFYGQPMKGIDETYPLTTKSPYYYSRTKAEAERRVIAANDPTANFETLSLRPRLIWGPGDQSVLPGIAEAVRQDKFMWIGGGEALTASTYIDNLVDAIELALEKGSGGEAYFIVDQQSHSFRELLSGMLETQNLTVPDKSIPTWLVRGMAFTMEAIWKTFSLKSDPPVTRFAAALMSVECTINSDKAERQLGYKPAVTMEQGFEALRNMK
ncbi:MAG: NAD-dependent epimerase/dehydratase family protein [Pseudomonadales bacterium]|nr:NAD-dependent epimerase/dehydratase family protein [Pseudomonadales bacterium]